MKKSDFDRIIVDKNSKMTEIINWFLANKEWLAKEEFHAPMESGLIVMVEEKNDIGFESLGDGEVKIYVYPAHIEEPAMTFHYDPVTTKVRNHQFPNKMRHRKEALLKLMMFAAHYEEIVEVDEKQNVRRTRHEAKMLRKNQSQPLSLVKKTYVIKEFSGDNLHRYGEKRGYTKPDHEVQVRGFYRKSKNGKKSWVKPFSRYKDKGGRHPKEYKV